MTRYFIGIKEAINVLSNCIDQMRGGEIFIPNNLKIFKILDLAKALKIYYKKPNIKIRFSGIRQGEKLFEKLYADSEIEKINVKKDFLIISQKRNNKRNSIKANKILKTREIIKLLKNLRT